MRANDLFGSTIIYVAAVMIDGDDTEERLLDEAAAMTDEELAKWHY